MCMEGGGGHVIKYTVGMYCTYYKNELCIEYCGSLYLFIYQLSHYESRYEKVAGRQANRPKNLNKIKERIATT